MRKAKTTIVTKKAQSIDPNIGKVFMSKDRARNYGLNPNVKMTLSEVTTENGVTYYEFVEVKGTKWPSSLFYLAE